MTPTKKATTADHGLRERCRRKSRVASPSRAASLEGRNLLTVEPLIWRRADDGFDDGRLAEVIIMRSGSETVRRSEPFQRGTCFMMNHSYTGTALLRECEPRTANWEKIPPAGGDLKEV
jgi:hypothetical protein